MKKIKYKLFGAILGDLAGQPYEFPATGGPKDMSKFNLHNPDSKITDDTVMTLATAWAILLETTFEATYKNLGEKYPNAGYGKGFKEWLNTPQGTIGNSWGNGCLMRAAPIMYTTDPLPQLIDSVICSHKSTIAIESVIKLYQFYKNEISLDIINVEPFKKFEVRADKTIDFCLNLFGAINNYGKHYKIEKAVEMGGDTDTNASIVGELSNYHQNDITEEDAAYVESKLDPYLLGILKDFNEKFKD